MIPQAPLEAIPETRLCLPCSQAVGGDFQITLVPGNLSKSGSLKKNYGSFTVHKTRSCGSANPLDHVGGPCTGNCP